MRGHHGHGASHSHHHHFGATSSFNHHSTFGRSRGLGMPQIVLPFYSNNMLNYSGPLAPFVMQFNNLTAEERLGVKVFNVTILGDIIQEAAVCCLISTLVFGGCCIFPLFLLCCDCYRKAVAELRNMPVESYMAIESVILQCPNIEKALVNVTDNMLDANKASILERSIVRLPKLIMFEFRNMAAGFNLKDNEYDGFDQCFPLTKQSNRFIYSLSWGTKITIFNNPQIQVIPHPYNQELSQMGFNGSYPNQAYPSQVYPPQINPTMGSPY